MIHLEDLEKFVPFICAAGSQQPHWNIQRIVEAVIIAAIAGGMSVWATQQVLTERISGMERSLTKVEKKVDQMQRDLYRPVK